MDAQLYIGDYRFLMYVNKEKTNSKNINTKQFLYSCPPPTYTTFS